MKAVRLALLALMPTYVYSAPPTSWKAECVGRMQLELPAEVEMAVTDPDEYLRGGPTPKFHFSDGSEAQFSSLQFGGLIRITRELSDAEKQQVSAAQKKWFEHSMEVALKKDASSRKSAHPRETRFERLSMQRPGLAWRTGSRWLAHIDLERHKISWELSVEQSEQGRAGTYFTNFANNLRIRPMFSVPSETGVCMPFTFVPDDGETGRKVAVTYQLKDHPDVTVMLEDASADSPTSFQDPEKFTAIYKSQFFWSQRTRGINERTNLVRNYYNNIKFAGQDAIETKYQLTRLDGTRDFGYLVVARGDPNSKVDLPDLMLYIVQDSSVAQKKGIKPIPRDEFFALAKRISSSVKHR